jgi:hypothetical protein
LGSNCVTEYVIVQRALLARGEERWLQDMLSCDYPLREWGEAKRATRKKAA